MNNDIRPSRRVEEESVEGSARNLVLAYDHVDNLTLGDTTPSIKDRTRFRANANGTITDFKLGAPGQRIHILGDDSTIVAHNSTIKRALEVSGVLEVEKIYTFTFDAGVWYEDVDRGGGVLVQMVNTQSGAVATGTTLIPLDDTIPQNTEGTEFLTRAITPTNSSNRLRIDVSLMIAANSNTWVIAALFQDSTANAIAAKSSYESVTNGGRNIEFTFFMVAGTTSSTTFKIRLGPSSAATVTLNGHTSGRMFGGVAVSSITISELTP